MCYNADRIWRTNSKAAGWSCVPDGPGPVALAISHSLGLKTYVSAVSPTLQVRNRPVWQTHSWGQASKTVYMAPVCWPLNIIAEPRNLSLPPHANLQLGSVQLFSSCGWKTRLRRSQILSHELLPVCYFRHFSNHSHQNASEPSPKWL